MLLGVRGRARGPARMNRSRASSIERVNSVSSLVGKGRDRSWVIKLVITGSPLHLAGYPHASLMSVAVISRWFCELQLSVPKVP